MATSCEMCGKKRNVGHNVSHAKNRSQKVWKPNLHSHQLTTDQGKVKVMLCTKCKRMVRQAEPKPAPAATK